MSRTPRMALLLLLLLGIVTAAASCSSKRRPRDERFPPITVEVENQNFYDATVYLLWQSDRRRLGVVGGNAKQSFTTNWGGPQVTVMIEMLAGRRYQSIPVGVSPGDDLVVEIPVAPERFHIYRRD
jgi:hypothetical protein